MNKSFDYKVVDVFTTRPLLGNPVAVVMDADDLDTDAMQAIAGWTNLSETTFVLSPTKPDADYRLRIFTPRSELRFAGHPTLGSAHAILESGRIAGARRSKLVQECNIGLVDVSIEDDGNSQKISFVLPSPKTDALQPEDVEELESIFGCKLSAITAPAIINVGAIWVVAQLPNANAVLDIRPNFTRLSAFEKRLGVTGVTVFGQHTQGESDIEVRTFAPSCGVEEDPVCGSGNGSVAVFLWMRNLLPSSGKKYVASQGRCIGRDGRILVNVAANGKINVGGHCVTGVTGSLTL